MTFKEISFPVSFVPIPLDRQGRGPCDLDKAVEVSCEIWDCNNLRVATACDETTAKRICYLLNGRFA